MRFWTQTKEKGEKVKKKVRDLCDKKDYISEADVLSAFDSDRLPAPETYKVGWTSETVLEKMRLRKIKAGWFLYLPEPTEFEKPSLNSKLSDHGLNVVMFEEEEFNQKIADIINAATMNFAIFQAYKPRCKVISKPTKNSIREEFGWSLGIFQLDFMKANDERVAFPVFVVMMDDGSVRQVKPENIIFEMEGDE